MSDASEGQGVPTSWLVAALLCLTGLAYANAIDHPFLYDDIGLIVEKERAAPELPWPVRGAPRPVSSEPEQRDAPRALRDAPPAALSCGR